MSDTVYVNLSDLADLTAEICVIIVNYNSGAYLSRCLAALAEQYRRDFLSVVFDNASTDDSLINLQKVPDHTFLVAFEENIGFSKANNLVGMVVKCKWIVTLNPDAILSPNWLEKMMEATVRYPDVPVFGSTLVNDLVRDVIDGSGDCYSPLGVVWRGNHGRSISEPPKKGKYFQLAQLLHFIEQTLFD